MPHRQTPLLFLVSALLSLFAILPNCVSAAPIEGQVFLDANGNGRLDPGESGVPGVLVSDGLSVVVSDRSGRYTLNAAADQPLVWITVPTDHAASGKFWHRIDSGRREDFGLVRRPQSSDFCFIQITDTHVGRDDLVREFLDHAAKFPVKAAFVVNTGDLVGGVDTVTPDKSQVHYDRYLKAVADCRLPLWNVPGNHEHVAINVKEADKSHPLYGKGLYRQVFGPTYYSWDWGGLHLVALDGTSLPYREKLGDQQLAWLKADLAQQPADKPIVLFCHQSIPQLGDAKQLGDLLEGRRLLGSFCGHLHSTFTVEFSGAPVYHTGAISGSWWSGPNPDGTPQGFRLVQIKQGRLVTAYGNREGPFPIYVSAPLGTTIKSGTIEIEVVLFDFGRPVEPAARFAGHVVRLEMASREDYWSVWKGKVDTTQVCDGIWPVKVSGQLVNEMSWAEMRYLVINGRPEPFQTDKPATLKLQVRGINAPDEILLNGKPLATIPADTPKETTLSFDMPADRLVKLNRVTIRAAIERGKDKDDFSVGPVWLEYGKKRLYDLRYVSFHRHTIGDANPAKYQTEKDLYFCLP